MDWKPESEAGQKRTKEEKRPTRDKLRTLNDKIIIKNVPTIRTFNWNVTYPAWRNQITYHDPVMQRDSKFVSSFTVFSDIKI